jgi:hypothetical protein
VVSRRILHAEEVVQHRPDVALTVARLAQADVQDHNPSRLTRRLWGLHREREPVPAVKVDATHDWFEWPGKPVRPELWSTRIPTKLVVYPPVAGSPAGQGVDKLAYGAQRDDLVLGHAASFANPRARTRKLAPRTRARPLQALGAQDRRAS